MLFVAKNVTETFFFGGYIDTTTVGLLAGV